MTRPLLTTLLLVLSFSVAAQVQSLPDFTFKRMSDGVDYTRRDNVAERLVKRFGAAIGEGAVKAVGGLPVLR